MPKQIVRQAPYLRRYARALTGSQAHGDSLVQGAMEALLGGDAKLDPAIPLRPALFRVLHQRWLAQASGDGEREEVPTSADARLQTLSPDRRACLLLVAMEGFPASEPGPTLDITTQERLDFEERNPYGRLVDGVPRDQPDQCLLRAPILGNDPDCFRWYPTGRPKVAEDDQKAENERYVGGGPEGTVPDAVERPDPAVNRAVGEVHGPGSTFKVVVAAAFLRIHPEAGPDSSIYAPDVSRFPDGQIRRNFSLDGREQVYCRGATAEHPYLTLKQALAVSCNTAFVELARSIGWDAIRDTAVSLGFGIRGEAPPAPLAGSSLGAASLVPRTASGSAIGNVALGGGEVDASPLQLASVMATIANGGHFMQPSLATALRRPGDAATADVQPVTAEPLSPTVASRLKDALAGTADLKCKNGCTARLLERPVGHDIWVKTGTQVVTRPDPPAGRPQPYAQEYSWLAGFMGTPEGPVAFAVALEAGKGDGSGSARARFVIGKVLQAVAKERG